MSTAMTKKDQEQALAQYGYDEDVNTADLDRDSYAIPRVALIEKLSPELEEGDAAYIEGAKAGQLVNKVMGTLHEQLLVIPVYRRRVYLEWVPRNSGGGFVAEHDIDDGAELMAKTERNDKNVDVLPNGNELHNVLEFYLLTSADDGTTWEPAIVSMSRTRMAEGKKWNQRIDNFRINGTKVSPLAQVYPLTSAKRDNPEGVSYVFKVGNAAFLPDQVKSHADVYQMAKDFLDAILGGKATVNRDEEAVGGAVEEEEDF